MGSTTWPKFSIRSRLRNVDDDVTHPPARGHPTPHLSSTGDSSLKVAATPTDNVVRTRNILARSESHEERSRPAHVLLHSVLRCKVLFVRTTTASFSHVKPPLVTERVHLNRHLAAREKALCT